MTQKDLPLAFLKCGAMLHWKVWAANQWLRMHAFKQLKAGQTVPQMQASHSRSCWTNPDVAVTLPSAAASCSKHAD